MVDSEHKTSFSEQNDNQVIYDDIDDTEIFATTHHSDDTVSHQQANNDLLEENKNLKKSVEELQEANKLLELRISQLYLTAKTEIERKDQRINEMRIEKENMFFRRNNRNQYVSNDQSSKNISQACNFERTVSKSNNIAENIIEVQNETSLNTDNKCGGNSESKCIKFENNSKTEYANQPNKSSKSEDEFSGKTSVIENNVHNQHNTNNIVDLRKCLDDQSSSKKSSNEVLQGFNKNYKIPRRISTYDDINTKSHIEPKHFENVYERSHSYKRNDVYKTCVKENKEDYIGHYMKDKNHTETHRKYIRDNQDRCKNWTEHTHSDNMEYMHSESAKHEPRYHRSYSPNKFNSRDRDGKDGYQHFKRNSRSRSRSPDRAWRKCSHHRARNRSRSQDRNASKYERKRYQRSRSRSRERYGTYYNDQKHLSYNQHSTCGRIQNRRCSRTKETFRDRFLKNRYESSQINVKGTTEKVNQNKMSEFKDTESLYSEEDEIKLFLSGESDFEEDKYTKNSDQHHIPDIANMTVSKLERLYIELKSRLNVENIPNTYSVPQFSEDEETDGILDVQHSYLRDHFDNHLSDEQENKDEMEDLIKQRTQQKYNKRSDERTGELSEAFKKRKRIGRSHSLNERYIDTRGNDDIVAKRFKHDRGYDKIQAAADNTRISEEPSKIQASDKNIKECCKDEKNNLIKDNSKVNITTIAGNTNMDGKNPQEINKTDEPTISKIQNITLEEYKKRNAMLGKTLQNQDSNKFVNVDNTSESKVSTKPDFDNMVVAQQSINEINSKFASASNSTVDISKVESSIRSYNLAIIGTNIKSEKVTKNGKTVLLKDKNTDGNNEISKLENDKIKNSGQSNVHKVENGEETILDSYTKIIDHSTKVDHGNAVDLENKISDLIDMQIKINSHKTNSGLGLLQKKQYANEQSCQEISAKNVNVDIKNKTTQNIKHKVTDEVQHQDSVKGDITNNKKSLKHDSKISDLVEKENTNEGQEKNRNANEARIKLNSDRENKTMTNIKNKVTDKVQQVDSIKCSSIDEESFKPQIKGYEVTKERKIEKELDLKKPNATEESSQKLSMKDLNAEHKIQTIANIKNKVTDEVQLKDPVKGNITNNKDSLKHHSKTSDLVKKGNKNERHQQKNQNANKSRIKHNSERENKTMKDIKNKVTDKVQQADSVNCSSIDKESFKQQIKEYDVMKERNIEKELDLNKTNTTEESNKKLSMKDLNAEDKIKGYDVMKERKIEKELDLKKTNTTKESNKKLSMKDLNAEDKIPTIANIKNKVTDEVQLQDSVKGNITNNKESMKHHSKTSDLVKKGNKNERHQQKNQNANKSRIKLNSERENKTMQDIKNKITDKVQQVDSVNCSSIDKESFKQQIKGYDVMKERKIEKELDLKKTNTTEESSQKLSMKDLNAEDKIQAIENIKNKVTDEVQHKYTNSLEDNSTNNKKGLKQQMKTTDQHLAQIAKESNRVENEAKVETEDIKADENMESLNNTIKISNNASDNNIEKNMDTRNVSNCNSENIKHKKTTNTKSNNIKNVKANQPGLKSTNSNNEAEHPSKLTQQCKRKQKYYDDNMKIEAAETLCSLATNQIYEQKLDNKKDQSESVNALREYDSESIQRKLDYRLAEELYITDSDEDEKACKNSKIDTEQNLTKRDQKCVIISNIPVALSQEDLKNLTLKNETTNSKSSINCNPSECIEEIKKEINTEYTKIPQLNAMCKKAENALNTPELEKCLSEDSAIKDTQRRRQPVVKRRSSSRLASIKHVQDAEERQQISVKIAESAKQVKDIFSSASKSIPIKNPDIPFDSPNSFIAKSQAKLSSEKDKKCIPCNDNVTEEKERKSELYQKAKNYIQTKLPRKTGRKCFKKAVKKTTLSRKCPSEKVTGAKPTAKTPRKRKTIEDEAGQTKPAWKIKLADNSKKRNRHDSTSDDPKRKKKKADEERDEKLQIESSKEKLTDTDNTTCSRSNIDMQSVLEVKNTEKITTNQDGTNNISEKIHTPESNSDLNIVVNNGKTLKRITPKRVGECTKNEKSSTVKVLFAEYSTTVVSQETINISQQARDCIKSSVVNIEINTVESNTIKEKSEQNQTAPSSSPLASFENLYLQANLKKLEKQSVVQKSTKSESNKPLTLIRAPEEAEFTDIHIDPITLLGKKEIDNIISDLNISDKNMALSSNSEKNKNDKISHNDGTTVDEKNLKSKTSSLDFLNILSKNTSTPIKNKNPSIKNDSTVSEHTIINSRPQSETINANEESSTKISNLNIPSNTSSDSSSIIIRSNITIGVPLKRDRRRKSTVKIID